jgi:hypothetical protein
MTSHMIIELAEPGRNYKAGENIEGVIKVLVDGYFDAASISLRLYGVDKASFLPMSESGKVQDSAPIRFSETILDLSFKLCKFADNIMQEKHSAYPFTISLPEWLPESVMLKDGSTTLAVIYFLTAQLDPRQDELFADKKQNLSLCRDERIIYIYRDQAVLSD